jgi:hypothetical protein
VRHPPRSALVAAVGLGLTLLARPVLGGPVQCPGDGFDAVGCDVGLVTAAAGCAPRAVRTVVKRMLRRVERRAASARRAAGRAEPRVAAVQLGRAVDTVGALRARLQALGERGRLMDDCAQPIGRQLDDLTATLTALRAGPSTTTTVLSPTSSTTATSSTLVGGPTTTATSTTSTTTVPTCGNGRLDRGEQCDGTNLFGRDCLTLGYHGGGQLMCRPDCLFEVRDCRR